MIRRTSNGFVEVHMIHPLGPCAVNNDEHGNPKRTVFGGYSRSVVSSQAQTRAFRLDGRRKNSKVTDRTRHLATLIYKELEERNEGSEDIRNAIKRACSSILKLEEIKGSKNMITVTNSEIERFASVVSENLEVLQKDEAVNKSLKEQLIDALCGPANVEVAMFGRWLAGYPNHQFFGALHVQPALDVHAAPLQTDFWSAIDDVDTGRPGAGLTGDSAYVTPTYYRYSLIDVQQLIENLDNDSGRAYTALDSTLDSIIETFPSAKARAYPAFTDLACVVFVVGINTVHMQMVNAFRRPVNPGVDPTQNALRRLEAHWKKVATLYEGYWSPATFYASSAELEGLGGAKHDSFKKAKEASLTWLKNQQSLRS